MTPGWRESDLHRWLARAARPRGVVGSPMHDAAVLAPLSSGRLRHAAASGARPVICVDQCIEGVHFEPRTGAALVGRKATNRALSDLAATAATPVAVVLALAAPLTTPAAHIKALVLAVRRAAREAGADLVGGDLSATSGPLALSVTALGRLEPGAGAPGHRPRPAPGRDRARPGQLVVLTGPVGGSRAARHLTFRPRIALGRALAEAGATALMDVSDGLAWDLHRLARASRVEVELDLDAVPIHRDAVRAAATSGRSALEHALHDGEDHELLATLARRAAEELCRLFRALAAARHSTSRGARPMIVGRVVRRVPTLRAAGLWLVSDTRRERWFPARGGFDHGG
jgi:thiamine-monophosphate kinase